MRKFDYSFLNNGLLPANLVNLTSNIAVLKTMAGVRKDEYMQIFTERPGFISLHKRVADALLVPF